MRVLLLSRLVGKATEALADWDLLESQGGVPPAEKRAYGGFTRSFTLPNVVDTEKIKADFKDGMLKLVLPKREEAKPKQISINVAK